MKSWGGEIQCHAPAALSQGKCRGVYCRGSWVGPQVPSGRKSRREKCLTRTRVWTLNRSARNSRYYPLHVHISYSALTILPLNAQHPCSVFGRSRVSFLTRCQANIIDFSVTIAKLSRKYWDGNTNYGSTAYFRNRVQIPLEKCTRLLC